MNDSFRIDSSIISQYIMEYFNNANVGLWQEDSAKSRKGKITKKTNFYVQEIISEISDMHVGGKTSGFMMKIALCEGTTIFRDVHITNSQMSFHTSIIEAMGKVFGESVWTNGMLDPDLSLYFRKKVDDFHQSQPDKLVDGNKVNRTVQPVKNIGIQGAPTRPEDIVWVLNDHIQIDIHGTVTTDKQPFRMINDRLQQHYVKVKPGSEELDGGECLANLLNSLEMLMQEVYPASLIMIGGACMAAHYPLLMSSLSDPSVPLVVAQGPPGCGKSTAMRAALACLGKDREAIFHRVTQSVMDELLTKSTIPFGWDDVDVGKGKMLEELGISTYNQSLSAKQNRMAKPLTMPLVTTNMTKLSGGDRLDERLVIVPFLKAKKPLRGNELENALSDIRKCESTARASFGEIVKMGEGILNGEMRQEVMTIREHLPGTILNDRKLHNMSILLWFVQKITKITGRVEDYEKAENLLTNNNQKDTTKKLTTSAILVLQLMVSKAVTVPKHELLEIMSTMKPSCCGKVVAVSVAPLANILDVTEDVVRRHMKKVGCGITKKIYLSSRRQVWGYHIQLKHLQGLGSYRTFFNYLTGKPSTHVDARNGGVTRLTTSLRCQVMTSINKQMRSR